MAQYNLKDKMNSWGPFEEREAMWHLFSVGNPNEGHGLALPRMIDDMHAQYIAHHLEFSTGQRYVGHIPYTTDRCGPVAKDWAPAYLPWEEFFEKSLEFVKSRLEILRTQGETVSKVMILVGHGGNHDLTKRKAERELKKRCGVEKVVALSAMVSGTTGVKVLNALEEVAETQIKEKGERFGYSDPEELAFFYSQLLLSAGHASHMEHSLAAAMHVCNLEKVALMNQLLEKDFETALHKWPPIGGLGGYLLAGGKYTEALGTEDNDRYGLWNCLNGLKTLDEGRLVIAPELGTLVHRISLEEKQAILQKT